MRFFFAFLYSNYKIARESPYEREDLYQEEPLEGEEGKRISFGKDNNYSVKALAGSFFTLACDKVSGRL